MNLEAVYIGESLWQGQLGHAFILLAFLAGVFSILAFTNAANQKSKSWMNLATAGFAIHGVATFSLIGMLFYIMITARYEYSYVYEHVSDDLPMKYIFSAFWEGQEGSFLLWMFWHIVLGAVILKNKYKLGPHVMAILMMVQTFITSMILGIYVGWEDFGFKLGSNPTLLLREALEAPIFSNPNYLEMVKGTGMNPLLQNYWMTIHPPTLFLGFASVTIPFAFAMAGLWSNQHKEWLGPAVKWGLFSSAILGTGILMGGAWAYVALSFGGYWAWDPVENMSLVPWLILIAGLHANLISKSTGYSIKTTYLLYAFALVLILYSTFLTRSGVLGETSAHAFTEMGLEWQLVAMVGTFFFLSLAFFFYRFKEIPSPKREESIYSREFWMYIGSIVLLFSGVIITTSSSLPVYNKIMTYFDPTFIGKVIEDPIPHYNKYQIWIASFITVLSSVSLWLRYKGFGWENMKRKFFTHNVALFLGAGLLTYLMSFWIDFKETRYVVLNIFCSYAVLANIYLLLPQNWKNLKSLAAASSHLGFGVMIIGTIASGLNEKVITTNPFALQGLVQDEDLAKVITLIKGEPFFSKGYWITYERDTIIDKTRFFDIDFKQVDADGNLIDQFMVTPNVVFSNDMTKVAAPNPATKHYLFKDIFTNIPSLPAAQRDIKLAQEEEDSLKYELYEVLPGDTFYLNNCYGVVSEINSDPKSKAYNKENNELGLEVQIEFKAMVGDTSFFVRPALGLEKNLIFSYPDRNNDLKIKTKIQDSFFEEYYTTDDQVPYKQFSTKQGNSFQFENYTIELQGLSKDPTHPQYIKEEGDIAISAKLNVTNNLSGYSTIVNPVYIIRGTRPLVIKEYLKEEGLHIKFNSIDPKSQEFSFFCGLDQRTKKTIPLLIAEDVPRSDWILLEALIFPGINLFWLGSILMMLGFSISLISRLKSKL